LDQEKGYTASSSFYPIFQPLMSAMPF